MATKGLSGRTLLIIAGVLLLIGIGLFGNDSAKNETVSSATEDQSDLTMASSQSSIASGTNGMINIQVGNAGPDPMQHTVNFTVSVPKHMTIRNPGLVIGTVSPDMPFHPPAECVLGANRRTLTCNSYVYLGAKRHQTWQIPVHMDAAAPANAIMQVMASAADAGRYTDPKTGNNKVAVRVVAARSSVRPPSRTPTASRPAPSTSPPAGTEAANAGRTRHSADKALIPFVGALWLLVGLVAIIVAVAVLISRQQRKAPLDYIPPGRNKTF